MATQTATRRVIYAPTDSVTRTVSVDLHPSDNAHTLRQKVADKTGVPPGDTSVQTWDASMTDQSFDDMASALQIERERHHDLSSENRALRRKLKKYKKKLNHQTHDAPAVAAAASGNATTEQLAAENETLRNQVVGLQLEMRRMRMMSSEQARSGPTPTATVSAPAISQQQQPQQQQPQAQAHVAELERQNKELLEMTAALTNKTAVLEQRRALDEELVRQLEAEAHNGAAWAQEALDLRTEVGKMESENVDNLNQLWRDQEAVRTLSSVAETTKQELERTKAMAHMQARNGAFAQQSMMGQLRAAMIEIARLNHKLDKKERENDRLRDRLGSHDYSADDATSSDISSVMSSSSSGASSAAGGGSSASSSPGKWNNYDRRRRGKKRSPSPVAAHASGSVSSGASSYSAASSRSAARRSSSRRDHRRRRR